MTKRRVALGVGSGVATAAIGPDFGGADGDQLSQNVALTVESIVGTVPALLTSKDAYVDAIAGCALDSPHGGEELLIADSTPVTAKEILIGFDLSALPVGTVTAAQLNFEARSLALADTSMLDFFSLTNAGETWVEGDVRCSNRPAPSGAVLQQLAGIAIGAFAPYQLVCNSAWRSRIGGRMGVGVVSFLIRVNDVGEAVELRSKEAVTGAKPTLDITFTV